MIRNFIYLDSEKLRSISSQLFEGVTERIILNNSSAEENSNTQKGPLSSGRLLGDIFSQERSTSELRFLEDHAYSLFEEKLIQSELVDVIEDSTNFSSSKNSFVKVTGRLSINDVAATAALLKDFNQLGEAQWRVTNEDATATKSVADNDARKQAAAIGLQMNKKFTDSLAHLLSFGFRGVLEMSVVKAGRLFSAPVKRNFLREDEDMIVHKYSRLTEGEFCIIGLVTNRNVMAAEEVKIPDVKDANGIKEAMRTMARHASAIEQTYTAPTANETIVDPIAVYSLI